MPLESIVDPVILQAALMSAGVKEQEFLGPIRPISSEPSSLMH